MYIQYMYINIYTLLYLPGKMFETVSPCHQQYFVTGIYIYMSTIYIHLTHPCADIQEYTIDSEASIVSSFTVIEDQADCVYKHCYAGFHLEDSGTP